LHCTYLPFALHSPDFCFENVVQVKRLVDTLNYTSTIIAMSDNTKLKERLGFSSLYGCIVGSIFLIEKTKVFSYKNIYQIVDTIKSCNAIASQVHDFADSRSQLGFVYNSTQQSRNCSIEEDANIGVINRKLNLSILINQRRKHEAYTNQRIERKIAEFSSSGLNNGFNASLVSFLSSDERACPGILYQNRWKMKTKLERLNDMIKNSIRLADISTANISQVHPIIQGGFGIGQLFYISAKVFFQLHHGLFSSVSDSGYSIFTHILPSSVIYYFGKGNFVSFDEKLGLLTVNNSTLE
ncbi:45888_t:CDS:2, partial [Gigaspora margarita]